MYNDILFTITNALHVLQNEVVLNRWVSGISSLVVSVIGSFLLYLSLKYLFKTPWSDLDDEKVVPGVICILASAILTVLLLICVANTVSSLQDMHSPNLYLLRGFIKVGG